MKAFIYNGEVYIRLIPAKRLFNSTTIHEVVNRGDIFAMRCSDQQFTVVPGKAEVQHIELEVPQLARKTAPKNVREALNQIKLQLEGNL